MKKDKGQLAKDGPQAETGGPAPHGGQVQRDELCRMDEEEETL